MEAWHFIKEDRTMQYSGDLVEVGKTYVFDGDPKLCEQGYHASLRAIDALAYSPGPVICRVRMGGEIVTGDDKLVANERHVIWMSDATETLREFARWCALEVAHLWDMPAGVRQYLETGDESLRAAAWDAARDAARAAAWAAAWDAAWDAARAAAWAAAWDAARDAAWDAARDAAKKNQNDKLEKMLLELSHD